MPWKIIERENEWCVYKVDDAGEPVEIVACHPSEAEAQAHLAALYANVEDAKTDRLIATGGAIKAMDDAGRIGGYLIVFGSPEVRDLQGEYFTPDTELELDGVPSIKALYHHGLDSTLKAKPIGLLDTFRKDGVGLWVEGVLNMRDKYVRAVWDMIKRGLLSWSSGSMPHQAKTADDGRILYWPTYEGSATPAPAEWRGTTKVMSLKTFLAGVTDAAVQPEEPTAKEDSTARKDDGVTIEIEISNPTEENPMNLIELIREFIRSLIQGGLAVPEDQIDGLAGQIANVLQPEAAMQTAAIPADQMAATIQQAQPAIMKAVQDWVLARETQLNAVKAAAQAQLSTMRQASEPVSRAGGGYTGAGNSGAAGKDGQFFGRVEMRTKYADLSAEDMSYYVQFRNAWRRRHDMPAWLAESDFMREMADKAGKAYSEGKIRFGQPDETARALKSINFMKANELDHSTQSGYGDEWVPTLWADQVWEQARLENVIAPLFQMVEMPSNPYELPVESTDPTVYFVPETTAETELLLSGAGAVIPDSKMATAKMTLTAKKLALRVGFSAELDEDSIIPWAAQLRKQSIQAMEDAIDNAILNGDDTNAGTGNINSDDADPADTQKYLAFDGLRHLWIVTTPANGVDGGGASISLSQIRTARFSMSRHYSANPNNLAIITHSELYAKILGLNEVITVDKYGSQATVLTGEIGKLDGMPVLISNEYPLTEADAKCSATPSNNTLGSLTIVYKPGWKVGYRRRVNATINFHPEYDSFQLTATVRLALARRDAEVAAGVYNSLV